ncbi:lipopolysaccharide biosynthesis protein [Novosphingobium album (ex Liu et al. 2023)]|uniref:Lipopolysaccharide biosynthesis protein n=1 Tax=Novosphingobium album (ex Liu et al. 2023) TaxID=3031130 RepID=A0ABT5WSG2_9SPHN|nr:lipopolysaccharide biosynthesis protein [Novosphingobium album (ex Liu et al. 2023)]MDE8652984.1 lipopolysaccharide biosynthesis protein [Novosphingobium album (ex Liu et al. 2023)]
MKAASVASPPAGHAPARSPLARILANTGWLIGGKGFGALCGLGYLAILTRALGLKEFGHFSLIFGAAQALIALAGFETWRVVVRYGARHVHQANWERFGRLGMLCGLIDALGAVLGCLIAFIAFYGFADLLDLNTAFIDMGFAFCCAMVWALVSAPTGMVRALHRFDRAVYVEAIVPAGRLIAAIAIWQTGPSVGRFLLAWALVDLAEAACYWAMARRLCPRAVRLSHLRDWRLALRENPGLPAFLLVTHAGGSIDAAMRHGPLMAAGALASTSAAGLYRLASQLTQALGKLSALLTRSVYAEIAHSRVAADAGGFRRLAVQTSLLAAAAGAIVVTIALLAGEPLLALIGGSGFTGAAALLVPLSIAASLELGSVAFEPVLHASGRARAALACRILGMVCMATAIALLFDRGGPGIAWSVAIGSAASYLGLGATVCSTIRRKGRS